MIESVTLGQIGIFVAFIVGLLKGIDFIWDAYKKPTNDLENQINKKLDNLQEDINITLQAVGALVQHEITGNHTNDMEQLSKKLFEHLTKRKAV